MPPLRLLLALCLLSALPAQELSRAPAAELDDLLRTTTLDLRALEQRYALRGAACLQRLTRFYQERQQTLEALPFGALPRAAQLDYIVFGSWLQRQLFAVEQEAAQLPEVAGLFPGVALLVDLSELERSAAVWPHAELSRRLIALVAALEEAGKGERSESLEVLRGARDWAERGRKLAERMRNQLTPRDPDFAWWLHEPLGTLQSACEDFRERMNGALEARKNQNAFAIGREAFARELTMHGVPHTPESLLAFGEEQLAAIEAQLREEAAKIAPGEPWQVALQMVKEDVAAPGEQEREVAEVAREAIAFCRDKALFRVPALAEEIWYLTPIDREDQRRFPFAYYSGNRMGVAFAEKGMSPERQWQSMFGNNRHFTRNVVPHELIPGHHLQRFYADRYNTARGPYSWTPFYIEGHGLYTELLLDEHGFFRTPEERIGSLFWRLLRAARIIVSTRYHLGDMSKEAMVRFMIERVGLEESGARGEVERYMTYSPLYQAAYMVGAHQILQLRAACQEAWGEAFSLRDFHEAFLRQNCLPIALIEEYLTGRPLSPDLIWRRPVREVPHF